MSDLIKHVTPLTRGIIWLTKGASQQESSYYADIDYLLDGLLTANLKVNSTDSSKVIVGQNFNHPIYIFISHDPKPSEVKSFTSLFKDLGPENDIIVIDESEGLQKIKPELKPITSNLRFL